MAYVSIILKRMANYLYISQLEVDDNEYFVVYI